MYYTYLLRCADGTLYAGITTDLARRMGEHASQKGRCAKYTKAHRAEHLAAAWRSADRPTASRLEFHCKRLTKNHKEALLSTGDLARFLGDKLMPEDYQQVEKDRIQAINDAVFPAH